jgi:predicted nuclease with TOPRIM domain
LLIKFAKRKTHKNFYKGVKKGIKNYCTYASGMKMGELEKPYSGACKGKAEEAFLRGHIVGKNKSEISRLNHEVTNLKVENGRLQEKINSLRNENSQLRSENYDLESEVDDLKAKLGLP